MQVSLRNFLISIILLCIFSSFHFEFFLFSCHRIKKIQYMDYHENHIDLQFIKLKLTSLVFFYSSIRSDGYHFL